ncbi:MAG TPA: NUDIX hydrolase [Candidatus Dojkabacteria bacterium]|nr:NUDIX hydrolase [Candidatus Dojkabacteria bacterium]
MNKWKLVNSKPVFESKWLTLKNNSYDIGNGDIRQDYYHIDRPDYVLIIAEDKDGKIAVVRQYRRGVDEILFELPAGWIDEGETPVQAAERELKEETGFLGKGILLGKLTPQPGFMSMRANVVLVKIENEFIAKNPSDDEIIERHVFDISKIKDMITNGEIKDMGFVSAVNLYLLSKKEI